VSSSIAAVTSATNVAPDAPKAPASLSGADFAATLRDLAQLDEKHLRRFARINAQLRVERTVYPDLVGCRSWLGW
jgi:hypothetical protein